MKLKNNASISQLEDMRIDDKSGALITIDHLASIAHEGRRFFHTQEEVINSAATSKFLLTVPASGAIFFGFEIESSLLCTVQIYEAGDRPASVTAITGVNRDRNSSTAPTLAISDEVATGGTTDGTLKYVKKWGAAAAGGKVVESEIQLKKSTKYLIVITSGAASNQVSTKFDWDEII